MDDLQQTRVRIDEIDAQMVALFEQRMQAVGEVARYKADTGKPVFDPAREAAVIDANVARVQNQSLRPYYRRFVQQAMAISRAYQRTLLGRDLVAYQGVQGAWSHIALRRFFPNAREQAFDTWAEVFDAVQAGDAHFGVLPFENSNAGDVATVLDLLYAYPDIAITHMGDLPIQQDLLALPGAKLEDITTVISHQQALAQSTPFLRAHAFTTRVWGNTADAARYVAEQGDIHLAAIASAETARLYNLRVLAEAVNEDGDNTTRFVVVEKSDPQTLTPRAGQRMSLLFTVGHKPGQLANVLRIIGEQGFNMECIKSRPLPHVPFEYYFYAQLVCPAQDAAQTCRQLNAALETLCRTVRLLGVYDAQNLEQETFCPH